MKVLLIHQAFVSPNEAGGTRHYELASYCKNENIEFSIVTSNLSYLTGKQVAEPKGLFFRQRVGVIDVLRARTFSALHRSFFWRVVSFISFMVTSVWAGLCAGPVDVVMGTTPPIFQAVSAWVVAAIRRKPFILEVRDLWPEFAIDMGVLKNPILISLSRWLERFLYSQADELVVNSPAYRHYLNQKHGISLEKITLIPNGVEVDMFAPADRGDEFRSELGVHDKFVITYAGAIGLANDIPTILRAAKRLKEEQKVVFLLIGSGKEMVSMKKMASELALDNVLFVGTRPKAHMPTVLAGSDVCLATLQNIPMFKTTYPNKVFDYMAAGRPTVLAIDGVIREVIENSKGGVFVRPGDDQALAETVLSLLHSPKTCKEMGMAARRYVEQHFQRKTHAKSFCDLLLKVKS